METNKDKAKEIILCLESDMETMIDSGLIINLYEDIIKVLEDKDKVINEILKDK